MRFHLWRVTVVGLVLAAGRVEAAVAPPPPVLALSKTASATSVNQSEPIAFTLTLSNTGAGAATNVTLTDLLPPGVTFLGMLGGPPPAQVNPSSVVWQIPLLSAGESQMMTIQTLPNLAGSWTNQALAQTFELGAVDAVSMFQVQPTNPPPPELVDLQLGKTVAVSDAATGDTVRFWLTLTNSGVSLVLDAVVADALPVGLQFVDALENGVPAAFDAASGQWTVGSLAPGEMRTLSLDARALAPGVWTNVADVLWPTNTGANTIPHAEAFLNVMAPAKADLEVIKIADPSGVVGIDQSLTNLIRIGNHGPADAKDIVVKDTVPAGVTLRSSRAPEGTTFDAKTLEWKIPALAANAVLELEIATAAKTELSGTNVVEITARGVPDPVKTNDRAEAPCQWIPYTACGTVKFCHPLNGDPHTNAMVELQQAGRKLQQTRTDAQGAFCFTKLPPGAYQIVAKPADPASGIKDSQPETVEFGDGKFGGLIQVTSPWPVIRGRIRYGVSGPPVPDIEVKLTGKDSTGKAVDAKTTTDQDGGYLFGDLADGAYTVVPTPTKVGSFNPLRAQFPNFFCQQTANFNYGSDKSIAGRVVTCDAPPVPVPYPTVTLASADFPNLRSVAAGVDGTLNFKGLTDGKYTVTATHPAYDIAAVDVTVRGGVARAVLRATPKNRVLYAVIKDAKGAPVAGVKVAIAPPGAVQPTATLVTDTNGAVRFEKLAARVWVVQPQTGDNKITFTPAIDVVAVGQPRVCRNSAVFTANGTAVELVAMEVVQVVQDWRNAMPLVEGKKTLVRVFLKPAGSSATPINVRGLQLKVEPVGGRAVTLKGQDVVARPDYAKLRNLPRTSLAFDLTPHAKGDVSLTLVWPNGFLSPSAGALAAGVNADNSIMAKFGDAPPLKIKWVLVDWRYKDRKDAATAERIPEHFKRLIAALPITAITADQTTLPWRPDYDPSTAPIDDNTIALYDLVAAKLIRDGGRSRIIYYVLVPGEIVRDNGIIGGNQVLIRAKLGDTFYRNRPGHEIGHSLGRNHAVHSAYGVFIDASGSNKLGACDEKAALDAPDFPMDYLDTAPLQPTLGPMRLGDYRLAYGWDSSDGTYVSPLRTADLMSYCTSATQWSWPGLYTYTNLYNSLVNRFGKGGAPKPATDGPGQTSLLIHGSIDPLRNAVTLDPVWTTLVPTDPLWPDPGEFTLALFDINGAPVLTAPFALEPHIDADPDPIFRPSAPFWFCFPWSDGIGALEIRRAEQLLLRRELSAHAPEVHWLAPTPGVLLADPEVSLAWDGSDADGDPLRYTLDVSSDAGLTWSTLAYNLSTNRLTVSLATLPGGAATLFRVAANDGLLQSYDQVNVTIADHGPTIAILSPAADAVLTDATPAYLEVWASDPEDGPLDGAQVKWVSDRDGELGTGATLVLDPAGLSDGAHQIEVFAVDSADHQVSATTTVTVRHDNRPSLRAALQGDEILLSWPAAFDLWQVEGTLDLGTPYWFTVSGDLEATGDPLVLHVPLTDDALFFRLVAP